MSRGKGSRNESKGRRDSAHRDGFQHRMIEVGFVDGTRAAYLRAFDRFEDKLDRKDGSSATSRV